MTLRDELELGSMKEARSKFLGTDEMLNDDDPIAINAIIVVKSGHQDWVDAMEKYREARVRYEELMETEISNQYEQELKTWPENIIPTDDQIYTITERIKDNMTKWDIENTEPEEDEFEKEEKNPFHYTMMDDRDEVVNEVEQYGFWESADDYDGDIEQDEITEIDTNNTVTCPKILKGFTLEEFKPYLPFTPKCESATNLDLSKIKALLYTNSHGYADDLLMFDDAYRRAYEDDFEHGFRKLTDESLPIGMSMKTAAMCGNRVEIEQFCESPPSERHVTKCRYAADAIEHKCDGHLVKTEFMTKAGMYKEIRKLAHYDDVIQYWNKMADNDAIVGIRHHSVNILDSVSSIGNIQKRDIANLLEYMRSHPHIEELPEGFHAYTLFGEPFAFIYCKGITDAYRAEQIHCKFDEGPLPYPHFNALTDTNLYDLMRRFNTYYNIGGFYEAMENPNYVLDIYLKWAPARVICPGQDKIEEICKKHPGNDTHLQKCVAIKDMIRDKCRSEPLGAGFPILL